ncbi:MAG: O-antigen ligase family protein [Anaerolineaceae bacterium]|nr:O-antigen ligase family protein [Anaerolineaceae bacterium]
MKGKTVNTINWLLWGVLFLTLPITSMPLVSKIVGGTMVAPPALLLLAGILVFCFLPYVVKGGSFGIQNTAVFIFFSIACISAFASFYIALPTYKIQPDLKNSIEALVTIAMGIGYFLAVQTWIINEKRLRDALIIVNCSGIIFILWALTQALYWHIDSHYPLWMRVIQESLSNGTMFARRSTGFAFEPSWLAHQLNVFYFPLWISAVYYRRSAFRWRIWFFQIEDALLIGGIFVLIFTSSRIGFLGFIMLAGFLFLLLQQKLLLLIKKLIHSPVHWKWVQPAVIIALVILYVAMLAGAASILQKRDPRMTEMFNIQTIRQGKFFDYAKNLTFASRVVYWQTGMQIFEDYPVLGVGPGNAGYFFYDEMSNDGWGLVEVRHILIRDHSLPNIKNLWVRLLAETGFIGFFSFLTFLLVMVWSGQYLTKTRTGLSRNIGFAAILSCLAMIGEGFSLDTFALPYTWLIFGMCVAATQTKFLSENIGENIDD